MQMLSHLNVCHSFCAVLDVNDEMPTFFPSVYNVSLDENVPRDYVVVRLNCTDNDAGLNAELSYFITGQSAEGHKSVGASEFVLTEQHCGILVGTAVMHSERLLTVMKLRLCSKI